MRSIDAFEQFKSAVHEVLFHLYDPLYRPPEELGRALGVAEGASIDTLRNAIITTLERLKPLPGSPTTTRAARVYGLLSFRYVHELTQKETALRLGITARHLRRQQEEAIHWLAQQLWLDKQRETATLSQPPQPSALTLSNQESNQSSEEWRQQVQKELVALQQSAPGVVADMAETLRGVLELEHALIAGRPIDLHIEPIEPGQSVGLHPTVLRQIVITAIEKLAHKMDSGAIAIDATYQSERLNLRIAGSPIGVDSLPQSEFIREIMELQGGMCTITSSGNVATISLQLPLAHNTTVLVVDDNTDLVHFYRRFTEGTHFQIKHLSEGEQLFEWIRQTTPDIIVLDVMLPDIDGWKLLIDLHNHPYTQAIPVVVCSVVRRQELAATLGATLYLAKPVRRQEFVQALEQALRLSKASVI